MGGVRRKIRTGFAEKAFIEITGDFEGPSCVCGSASGHDAENF